MAKIVHYRRDCIGCNSCVEHDAIKWKLSEKDGKSDLIGAKKHADSHVLEVDDNDASALDKAELVAKDCPSRIIKVIRKK